MISTVEEIPVEVLESLEDLNNFLEDEGYDLVAVEELQ